jgi:hypothetical protein
MAESYLAMTQEERADTLVISPANEDRFDVNEHIRNQWFRRRSLKCEKFTDDRRQVMAIVPMVLWSR